MQPQLLSTPFSRRATLRGTAMLGAGAALSGLPFAPSALAQDSAANRWPGVAQFVNSYVGDRKVAGMVAAMGIGQSEPDFVSAGSRTFDGGGQVGADSLFRIYSMTKPITGMATMMCVDDGLLGLDQPLYEILPAFRNMRVQKQYDGPVTSDNLEPATRPITIRHLLTHTAGLGYSIVQQGPLKRLYEQRGLTPGAVSRMAFVQEFLGPEPTGSLADFADSLAEVPLALQPGTRWSYSVSLDLLGRVIEVVSGQSFESFLQSRIFDPCGMESTSFRVAREDVGRLTANYFILGGLPVPIDLPNSSIYLDEPAFAYGGAGLVSSARDYDRFLQMLAGWGEIEGRRVMSETAVRLGTSDLFPETLAANGRFRINGTSFGYGAGGLVGSGELEGLFGWAGAAGTVGSVNLRYGVRHNMMVQYMPAEAYDAQANFSQTVMQDAVSLLSR